MVRPLLMHKVSTSVREGYWQTQFSATWLPLHHIQLEKAGLSSWKGERVWLTY